MLANIQKTGELRIWLCFIVQDQVLNLIGEKSLSRRDIITLTNLETEGEALILAIVATDLYTESVDISGGQTLITSNYLPTLEVNIDTEYDWILTANYEENTFVFEKKIAEE